MSGLFLFGLIVLAIAISVSIYCWKEVISPKYPYDPDNMTALRASVISLGLLVLSCVMLYYGYTTYSHWLAVKYDHGNGYMTVVEYSMAGDSCILENVRTPKTTYGKVVKVETGSHFVGVVGKGGHRVSHSDCTVRLTDGREFEERVNSDNVPIGTPAEYDEIFYPHYRGDLYIKY